MFQFPRLPPARAGGRPSPSGFPHSGTPGSKPVCGSPGTFAACRALRRLPAPRHPPCALHTLGDVPLGPFVNENRESLLSFCAMRLSGCPCVDSREPRGPDAADMRRSCCGAGFFFSPSVCLPRKEVIQPHLPVRLPCYDFTPLTLHTFDASAPVRGSAGGFGCRRLGWCDGRCVQGPGTHSPRRADPRLLATPASRRRVAACDPNWGRLCGVRSRSRGRIPLCRPL